MEHPYPDAAPPLMQWASAFNAIFAGCLQQAGCLVVGPEQYSCRSRGCPHYALIGHGTAPLLLGLLHQVLHLSMQGTRQ